MKTLNEIELSKILATHDGVCLLPFDPYSLRSMKILVPKIRRLKLAEHYAAFCSETNMFEQMFEDRANTLCRKQNGLLPFAFSSDPVFLLFFAHSFCFARHLPRLIARIFIEFLLVKLALFCVFSGVFN